MLDSNEKYDCVNNDRDDIMIMTVTLKKGKDVKKVDSNDNICGDDDNSHDGDSKDDNRNDNKTMIKAVDEDINGINHFVKE